jgi:hypothetical protein
MDLKIFKKPLFLFIAVLIFTSISEVPLFSEYVFLKDGSIIDGAIISDSAESVTLRLKDNKIKQIPRKTIIRILYTELYMGKVYVQKTDGKNVICYLVDEDRETYTFRTELFNPEEFTIKREQVLFMARGNPTGLEGDAGTDQIRLKWFPPYNPVKKYRINIKGPEDKIYRPAGETSGKSITLKGLKSNTKYQLHVVAIDDAGDESLPSNELSIRTVNLPPTRPRLNPPLEVTGWFNISWDESTDSDGKLAGYRIYKEVNGSKRLLFEQKKNEKTLPVSEKSSKIYVAAFDDMNTESEHVMVFFDHEPAIGISVSPSLIVPLGDLGKLSGTGYGLTLRLDLTNWLFKKLYLGTEISYFTLPGKKDFSDEGSAINELLFLPAVLTAGYSFYPVKTVALTQYLSAGVCYISYNYDHFDFHKSDDANVKGSEMEPVLSAGASVRYDISRNVYLNCSADFRVLLEESEQFYFFTLSAGAGYRF